MNWFTNREWWQKILYANVVFAVLGAIAVYFWLSMYDWVTNLYLGVVIAACIAATVVGFIERRVRGEKFFGHREQKLPSHRD